MNQRLCRELFPVPGGVISHGFENSANRLLIISGDAPKLIDQAVFNIVQNAFGQICSKSGKDVGDIKTELSCDLAQVRRGSIACSCLVICLSPLNNTNCLSNLSLGHSAALPFFLQARTNIFRKMQNYSSQIFTNASKCIILHFTPHEIAWICTMPKTSISEQARERAREALEKRGQSAKDFALLHNLSPSTVYAVLSGQSQCRRGEAHRAAVLLGVKKGVIEQ